MKRIKLISIFIFSFFLGAEAQTKLESYEYWFNGDYSNKQVVAITPATEHQLVTNMDVSDLPDGVNVLNARYKDENGLYSSTLSKVFYKNTETLVPDKKLQAYELWFNSDFGNKQVVAITPATEHQLVTNMDVSDLPDGVNVLNARYKDENGLYSSTLSKVFYKNTETLVPDKKLTEYELWFNSDYGNKQKFAITPASQHQLVTNLDASALPEGVNVLNIRYKDENNRYSSTLSRVFFKSGSILTNNKITAYRYWFDDDFGNAVYTALETPVKEYSLTDNLDASGLPVGEHTVHFQFLDSYAMWSVITTDSITKTAIPLAAFSVSGSNLCSGSAVQFVNESIDTDTWLWDFGDGTTSNDFEPEHVFTGAGDFDVSLTATDSESGSESSVAQTLTINPTYGSPLPSAENIIAYYSFNGNANDTTSNANHGTAYGATLTTDRFGNENSAYAFNGENDYILCNTEVGPFGNSSRSISFWAKTDVNPGSELQNSVLSYGGNIASSGSRFEVMLNGKCRGVGIDVSNNYIAKEFDNSDNDWHHYVVVFDNTVSNAMSDILFYADGQLLSTTCSSKVDTDINTGDQQVLNIGRLFTGSRYFRGSIDDIKIYDKALTENEVQNEFYHIALPVEEAIICASEAPYTFGTQQLTETGTYTETFQTIHGCDSVVTLNLQVNPGYDVMYSGDDAIPDYLVNETFEEVPLNTFPDDWIIRYNGTGWNDHYVVDDPVKNGVHAMKVSGSGWAANLSKPVENIPDNVVLEGWMRAENVASDDRNGLGIGNPDVGSWGAYWGRVEFYNGNLITFNYTGNSGGYGTQYVLQPASPNTWYHVKIEADAAAGTYKVYIDGQQASSATGGSTTTEFPLLTSISATSVELYGNGMVYFDDIRMYEAGDRPVVICESETPYIFGDQELTESGTYTETFQTIHGCDSVVTLNLIVNPTYNHTETAAICEGETYVFGTQNLTTSGEYTEVFESVDGCDSTVVLTLTVNPGYNHTDEQTICEGETYVFGTQNLTTSGEYTELFESVNGCDSTVVLTLTVNPGYNHTDEQTICEGETYVFGNQNLTTSGEYTELFESVNGCDSTVVLTLTVNPGYNHTDEQTICEGETYVFGTQNLTTPGEYTEVFESVNGCDSTVVLTLTVNPGYNHTDEQTICEGETYVFGTQNLTTSGEYTEVFESVNGCDSTVVLTLTVNPGYNHTETASICDGESYDFGETSYTESGEYTHTFNSVNGCDSIVTLTLTVNPVYDETVEVTIHEDELPYIFGGESLNESGVYTKTFASVAGCDSIVTLTLTVLEYSVPVAVCNPVTIYLNETGNYSLSRADLENIAAGSSDAHTAFADLILSVAPNAFTCADAGNEVDVMVIVTNEDDYSDTCYTTVSVEDNIPPQVDCRDLEVYLDANGEASIDVKEIFSDSWDACGIKRIYTPRKVFTCDDLGNNYFSVSVTDFNQNKTSCLNILAVFDTIRPVFGTVADIEVAAPEGECKAKIDYPEIPDSDNCGVENLFLYEGLGPDGEFPVGTTTERWVAVDASGNSDTLSFEITVLMSYADPFINPISDVEVLQGTEMVSVQLSGIFGGAVCETLPLEFALEFSNEELVDSYSFEHELGDETGTLKLTLADNVYGESLITVKVVSIETGKAYYTEFILFVSKVNHPPYLVQHPENLEMNTGDTLSVILSSEKGELFDDNDEGDSISLSLRVEDGSTLPEWLTFRNDSLIAYPAVSDTGCYNLLLVAADLDGEEAFSSFTLCVSFSSGIQLLENLEVKVYPNPTSGRVYVDFSGYTGHKAEILVTDILGKVVLRNTLYVEERLEIDLSDRVTGIYFLKIILNGDEVNRKLILVRDH